MRSAILLVIASCLLLLQVGSVVDPPALSAGRAQRRQLQVRLSHCRCVGRGGRRRQNATVTVTDDKVCSGLTTRVSAKKELSDRRFHLKIVKSRVYYYIGWTLPQNNKSGKDVYLRFLKKTRNGQEKARHRRCFRVARSESCRHVDCEFITASQRHLKNMEVALFFRGKFIPLTDNSRAKSYVRNPRHNKSAGAKCSEVECDQWRPKVTATQTGEGKVTVKYHPLLDMQCALEVSLAVDHTRMHRTTISHNVSEIHFTNVKKGEYVALIRPTDSTCEPTSNPFIVKDVTCSTWLPKVNAVSLSKSGDVMVTFYPPNSLAKKIEVCMERKGSKGCVHHKEVPTDTQNVTFFNINEGTYKAMVRPVGCFDCRDYQDLGVTCSLGFVESTEEITVGGHTETPVSKTALLETTPNWTRTNTSTDENSRGREYSGTMRDQGSSERQNTETTRDQDSSTPLASTHSENSTESTSSTNPETDPPRRSFHQTVKDLFVPILVPTAVFVFAFALAIIMWLACKGMPACERVRDETTVKISMSRADAQSEVPPSVPRTKDQKTVFIVYTDHDEHYRGLYIALANALRQLHWTVKMDCLCRSENEGDVIAWTHSTYHVCDAIIVFVSGCLATTCLCDWMSHEKVRDNPSQFDCIAPRVLLKIKARGGKDVVFVSFGTQEEKAYHHDLWTRPIPSTRLAIDDAESEKLRSRSLERTVHYPDRTSCNPGGSSPSSTSPNADSSVALYEISSDEDVRPLLMRFCVDRTAVDDVLDNSLEGIKLKNWFSMKRSKVRASVTTSCRSCRQIALGNVRVPQEHAEIPC